MFGLKIFGRGEKTPTAKLTDSLCRAFKDEKVTDFEVEPNGSGELAVKRGGLEIKATWDTDFKTEEITVGGKQFPGTKDETVRVMAAAKARSRLHAQEHVKALTKRLR